MHWGRRVGYAIPFLFVLTLVVFFHELAILAARWCGVRCWSSPSGSAPSCSGSMTVTARAGRCGHTARRVCQILRDDNAASVPDQAAIAAMSEEDGGTASWIRRSIAGGDRGRRRWRTCARDRHLLRPRDDVRQAEHPARVDPSSSGSAAAAAGFSLATWSWRSMGSRSKLPDMQQIVSTSATRP